MGFLLKIAFWACVAMLFLPRSEAEKEEMYSAAARGVSDFSTFCVRHEAVCSTGRAAALLLVDQIKAGADAAAGMLRDEAPRAEPTAGARPLAPIGPGPAPGAILPAGTLTAEDMQPDWRGERLAGR